MHFIWLFISFACAGISFYTVHLQIDRSILLFKKVKKNSWILRLIHKIRKYKRLMLNFKEKRSKSFDKLKVLTFFCDCLVSVSRHLCQWNSHCNMLKLHLNFVSLVIIYDIFIDNKPFFEYAYSKYDMLIWIFKCILNKINIKTGILHFIFILNSGNIFFFV